MPGAMEGYREEPLDDPEELLFLLEPLLGVFIACLPVGETGSVRKKGPFGP